MKIILKNYLQKSKFETVWLIEIVWLSSLLCMVVRVMIFETLTTSIDIYDTLSLLIVTYWYLFFGMRIDVGSHWVIYWIVAFILDHAAHHHRYKCLLPINVFITCSLPLMTIDIYYTNCVHYEWTLDSRLRLNAMILADNLH